MQQADILSLAGLRLDGRTNNEIRKINISFDMLSSSSSTSDGIVYYEQGLNKIMASLYGPKEPTNRKQSDQVSQTDPGFLTCRLIVSPFSGFERKKRKAGDRRLYELENIIIETFKTVVMLELYPKSEISIAVHVFESDGSLICAIINAISLVMMSAGINMKGIISSCSIGINKSGEIYTDVTQIEQNSGSAYLPIAILSTTSEVIYMQLDSRIPISLLEQSLVEATKGCEAIRYHIENVVMEYITAADLTLYDKPNPVPVPGKSV